VKQSALRLLSEAETAKQSIQQIFHPGAADEAVDG
jgi:hypothetical protein